MPVVLEAAMLLAAAAPQTTQASVALAADPKLVAVVEQNKAEFERCMADLARKYPPEDPALEKEKVKLEAKKKQSQKDLERLRDIALARMRSASGVIDRTQGERGCAADLARTANVKLKEASADEAAAAAALEQWKAAWMAAHP